MNQLTKYPVWLYQEDGYWYAEVATRDLVAVPDRYGSADDALYSLSRSIAGTLAFVATHPDEKLTTWDDHLQRPASDYDESGLVHPETMPDVQLVLMTVKKRADGVDIEFSTGRSESFNYSSWDWEKKA